MTASIRISAKAARAAKARLDAVISHAAPYAAPAEYFDLRREIELALSALDRKRLRQRRSKAARATKKETGRERMAKCRAEVFERSEGQCEIWLRDDAGKWSRCERAADELEHVFKRKTDHDKYSPSSCLAACADHHRERHREIPSAEDWQERYRFSFNVLDLFASARRCDDRRHFEGVKSRLPAAPGVVER